MPPSTIAPGSPAHRGTTCRRSPGPVIQARAVTPAEMSPTEQKYGLAPQRGQGIEFQDDVVLIEHGDTAIQSRDTTGLGWTLDASNPQVASLKQGDSGGIGYGLPKVVVEVVNFFLGLFHADPIADSGVLVSLPKQDPIVNKKESIPGRCAG